nr:lytic transglycosylase domain-containing protein [Methyloversatilis thermotolerans]
MLHPLCLLAMCLLPLAGAQAADARAYRLDPAALSDYRLDPPEAERIVDAEVQRARREALDNLPFSSQIEMAAREGGIDPELLHAVVQAESAYNPQAVSPKGALGLAQLMPSTALQYGVRDAMKPADNLKAGARHLRDLLDEFGSLELALSAYNAGAGAVRRYGGIPPYPETLAYVPKVSERYETLKKRAEAKTPSPPPSPYRLRTDLPALRLQSGIQ